MQATYPFLGVAKKDGLGMFLFRPNGVSLRQLGQSHVLRVRDRICSFLSERPLEELADDIQRQIQLFSSVTFFDIN